MTYDAISDAAANHGLIVMGALDPDPGDGTLILLGAGAAFWPVYSTSSEASDGAPDPIDRWSTRVIGDLAERFRAAPVFPFGGPPYAPFIRWAEQSGRAFKSPVGMLVHETVGLMISYRGALQFSGPVAYPAPAAQNPCDACPERPCTTACPVAALTAEHPYDLDACHGFLDSRAGQACMTMGCAARRACPVSAGAERRPAQSAHHMKEFHPS
ncbi:ferredoxin [Arenibacterium sp. CAU 1754]